ncbi:hypothetical protein H072_4952 [Dactylellina haptotyla CBS 200.50]|uniref:Uncharacterized protein n=1 Tax=Dactylellina haptotyla (strain CBS 200.50) TaxID=1284197 RepID=S8BNP5_DACHA|nr:hypothetical protein H072_4952 [Dactylellina haptotyla CBS 200.50]
MYLFHVVTCALFFLLFEALGLPSGSETSCNTEPKSNDLIGSELVQNKENISYDERVRYLQRRAGEGASSKSDSSEWESAKKRGYELLNSPKQQSDQSNPSATIRQFYTSSGIGGDGFETCPSEAKTFLESIGSGGVISPERTYLAIQFTSNFGGDVVGRLSTSVKDRHIVASWKDTNLWYEYQNLLFLAWGVARTKYSKDNPGTDRADLMPKFVTIMDLQNEETFKILRRAEEEYLVETGDLFELNLPKDDVDSLNIWATLLGTPEIGAVQKMLSFWPKQFEGLEVRSIRYILTGEESQDNQASQNYMIMLSLKLPSEREEDSISHTALVIIDMDSTPENFPDNAREAFEDSTLEFLSIANVKPVGNTRKRKAATILPPTFKRKTFQWDPKKMPAEALTSGREKLILFETDLYDIGVDKAEDLGNIIFGIWKQSEGASALHDIAFMYISPRTSNLIETTFEKQKIDKLASLTVWASKESRNLKLGLENSNVWDGQKINDDIYRDLQSTLELEAIFEILSNAQRYLDLGQPTISSVEIGHRRRIKISKGEVVPMDLEFTFLIRLNTAESGELTLRMAPDDDGFAQSDIHEPSLEFSRIAIKKKEIDIKVLAETIAIAQGVALPSLRLRRGKNKKLGEDSTYLRFQTLMDSYNIISSNIELGGSSAPISSLVEYRRYILEHREEFTEEQNNPIVWSENPMTESFQYARVVASREAEESPDNKCTYDFAIFATSEDLDEHSSPFGHVAISSISGTQAIPEASDIADAIYVAFTNSLKFRSKDGWKLTHISVFNLTAETTSLVREVFNLLNLSLEQSLLLDRWKLNQRTSINDVLGVVFGTLEVLAVQRMTSKFYLEVYIARKLVRRVFIRWVKDATNDELELIYKPEFLVVLAVPPSDHPLLPAIEGLPPQDQDLPSAPNKGKKAISSPVPTQKPKKIMKTKQPARLQEIPDSPTRLLRDQFGSDSAFNMYHGMELLKQINSLTLGINLGVREDPLLIREDLLPISGKEFYFGTRLGIQEDLPPAFTIFRSHLMPEDLPPIDTKVDQLQFYENSKDVICELSISQKYGILFLTTPPVNPITENRKLLLSQAYERLWTLARDKAKGQVVNLKYFIITRPSPRTREAISDMLTQRTPSISCNTGQVVELTRPQSSNPDRPYLFPEPNNEWVTILSMGEVAALVKYGMKLLHHSSEWYLPARVIIVCPRTGNRKGIKYPDPRMAIQLQYYSSDTGREIAK